MELSQIKSTLGALSIEQMVKLKTLLSLEDQFMNELNSGKSLKASNDIEKILASCLKSIQDKQSKEDDVTQLLDSDISDAAKKGIFIRESKELDDKNKQEKKSLQNNQMSGSESNLIDTDDDE